VRVLTDPMLRSRLFHLRRRGGPVAPQAVERIDTVLISHLDQDHLDLPSLRRLPGAPHVIVPSGGARLVHRAGLEDVREVRVGDRVDVRGQSIRVVPAFHRGRRRPLGPAAEAVGYVVSGASRVYFAGDTGFFDGMADIGPGLDAALLPVSGWGPTRGGEGHLDPRSAARALRLLRPRLAVPIHWGTLFPVGSARRLGELRRNPASQFARMATEIAPEVEVRVLEPGESTVIT
jgi:L-ascorbate metabolism protein UlaG (beta-lactamase superfamily)